jgi:hypothetical protein
MAMNRQQRRIMAKRSRMYREVADEYEKEVSAYKDRIDSTVIEQFFVAAGMALHNLYGWKANGIGRFWKEMDSRSIFPRITKSIWKTEAREIWGRP